MGKYSHIELTRSHKLSNTYKLFVGKSLFVFDIVKHVL